MNRKLQVWKLISRCVHEGVAVMLLYVLESHGSSPGREGFCMAVRATGEMVGSIGGGIMEHKFVEMAKDKLKQNETECTIFKQMHDKVANKYQSGMICSGEQSNLMYTIRVEDGTAIGSIIKCLEDNGAGTLRLSVNGIEFDKEIPEEVVRFEYHGEDEKGWLYEERIGYNNHLHIIGAGHCALALSKVMSMMDFYIHLYDDRENLDTYFENEFVHQKTIVKDYTGLRHLIASHHNNFVVVMTVGYRTDDIVVRLLMDMDFKYFGVLGSGKKIEKMFADYAKEGISEEIIRRIQAPIGLQVNSQTPEEIAISIAAQIIQVKNSGRK